MTNLDQIVCFPSLKAELSANMNQYFLGAWRCRFINIKLNQLFFFSAYKHNPDMKVLSDEIEKRVPHFKALSRNDWV